jgi:hypothetical protein
MIAIAVLKFADDFIEFQYNPWHEGVRGKRASSDAIFTAFRRT